jgi:hypothetical protein
MKDKIYMPPENDKFEDIFKLKCQMQIKLNDQKGPKPPIKNSIDNKCCFCGVENNGRNFSNRAHIIPASFGNKTYFSKDECNNCNKKFGQEYESELSEYFLIQRLLDNINKRDNKVVYLSFCKFDSIYGKEFS